MLAQTIILPQQGQESKPLLWQQVLSQSGVIGLKYQYTDPKAPSRRAENSVYVCVPSNVCTLTSVHKKLIGDFFATITRLSFQPRSAHDP